MLEIFPFPPNSFHSTVDITGNDFYRLCPSLAASTLATLRMLLFSNTETVMITLPASLARPGPLHRAEKQLRLRYELSANDKGTGSGTSELMSERTRAQQQPLTFTPPLNLNEQTHRKTVTIMAIVCGITVKTIIY